ncbi:MAG: ABC transporter permease [Bacteroidales bacterium]|nr:ABC transporter permease [Bacteroidales bacterium]
MTNTRGQRIRSVVRKEFRHIFRDRVSSLLLFLMPAVILLLFGYALSFEVHHYNVQVCNPGHSVVAERLFARLEANPKIHVVSRLENPGGIAEAFARSNTRAVVLYRDDGIDLFLDGTSSLLASNLEHIVCSVLADFQEEESRAAVQASEPVIRFFYNPSLKKEYMPVPGLVLMIFILVSSIVLGTSVNKEKVQGTFRLLKMTRMSNGEIILGKALPYFIISLFHVAVVFLACLYFGIVIKGSLTLFFGLCILYSVCCMSLGLLIASWFDRPLDVLILSWIVLFIPNVFLSGFIFPVSSMEGAFRTFVDLLPGTAFISAFRNIAYKGTGFADNLPFFLTLGAELLSAAVLSLVGFKRRIPR